jgi:cytosine/adenosine deaminase-related metal-dependent hydrolase/ubiquinone/menaquinone biosynthesis C-methylase UbiE
MASTSSMPVVSVQEGYRKWARSYDAEPNALLALERCYLEPLLPSTAGLDVIDLGCGTGRWLEVLKESEPRSLLGVDASLEMLRQAKRKLGSAARFAHADGSRIPLPAGSADVVLGNFVLSYVESAYEFLANARAVLREGGSFFLTDVHPGTSAALAWRRGVRSEAGFQEIRTFERSIDDVITLCERAGLRLSVRLEPCFGAAERELFKDAGKLSCFEQAVGYPAIYILQFRPAPSPRGRMAPKDGEETISQIHNACIALGAKERIRGALNISKAGIEEIGVGSGRGSTAGHADSTIDLQGYLLLPGLVNAHDHLEFALFPRLGSGGYTNYVEWAEEIHRKDAAVIAKHRQIPKEVRLWWGGIRNLLCGATTVSHHNPYDAGVSENDFAVRVVREYGWAHSLMMDAEAVDKKLRTPAGQPFLIHLAEGIDKKSEGELRELHDAGALDKDTVLIHGLGLSNRDRALLRAAGAGLIWCPSSNVFLFGRTLSTREIESLPHVALGSDSTLTAEGDLLDEVRFALGVTQLPVETVYKLVTRQAARLLKLHGGQGTLRAGGVADMVAVRDRGLWPADALAALSYRDIELVLIGGRAQLASDEMLRRLPRSTRKGLQPLAVEDTVRWIRAPLERLFRETSAHLPEGIFLGGKRVSFGIHH